MIEPKLVSKGNQVQLFWRAACISACVLAATPYLDNGPSRLDVVYYRYEFVYLLMKNNGGNVCFRKLQFEAVVDRGSSSNSRSFSAWLQMFAQAHPSFKDPTSTPEYSA